jgi:tRNA A-37 threonylcarbamoyl transferase component Bud32
MSDPRLSDDGPWVERLRQVVGSPGDGSEAVPPPASAGAAPPPLRSLSRYEVRERLGEGATAVVYRAWDRDLRRPVAIKVLKDPAGTSPIARERFRREAQAAANLAHPHIVQVHDVGEEDGRLFLVMELVEGKPLAELLRERALDERKLAKILEKAGRGVAAANARGIVHRDLKPANILVTAEGEPKVADFGLAHLIDAPVDLTRSGTPLGTPPYMSPEQIEGRGKEISSRTDVYALGAILYEGLVGRTVHQAESAMELYQKIVRDDPVPPRALRPALPRDLETVCLKALRREPASRYGGAEEFSDDLARYLAGQPVRARPVSSVEKLWRGAVRRRASVIPGAAALLLGLALLWGRLPAPAVGRLEHAAGEVSLMTGESFAKAAPGQLLRSGQSLRTGGGASKAVLVLPDGSRLELGPETTLQGRPGRLFLTQGTMFARRSLPAPPLEVSTPHGSAALAEGELLVVASGTFSRLEAVSGPGIPLTDGKGKSETLTTGRYIVLGEGHEGKPRAGEEGLIGLWTLRDLDGKLARDASGHGNDGYFPAPPPRDAGRRGSVVRFDGQVGFDVPTLNGSRFPRSGTLALWICAEHDPEVSRGILDVYEPSRRHLFLRTTPPKSLQVAFQAAGPYAFARNVPIPEREWVHVALTWSLPGKASLYINGSLDYSGRVTEDLLTEEQIFSVGGIKVPGTGFVGRIEDLRLYDRILPLEAIQVLAAP